MGLFLPRTCIAWERGYRQTNCHCHTHPHHHGGQYLDNMDVLKVLDHLSDTAPHKGTHAYPAAIPRLRQTPDWAARLRQKSPSIRAIWAVANRQNSSTDRKRAMIESINADRFRPSRICGRIGCCPGGRVRLFPGLFFSSLPYLVRYPDRCTRNTGR